MDESKVIFHCAVLFSKPRVREAWSHCRSLLLPDPSPLDASGPLRSLVELLSLRALQPRPQPRPLPPALVLGMLVNAAVVSTEPGGGGRAAEVFRAVRRNRADKMASGGSLSLVNLSLVSLSLVSLISFRLFVCFAPNRLDSSVNPSLIKNQLKSCDRFEDCCDLWLTC